jgi:hypothetical protein
MNRIIVDAYANELFSVIGSMKNETDPREVINLCRIATNMVKNIRQLADVDLRELDRDTGN